MKQEIAWITKTNFDILPIIGFFITFLGFGLAIWQYIKQKRHERMRYLMDIRSKFKGDARYTEIRRKIEYKESLSSHQIIDIYDIAGFYEELQIAINSNLISKEMVYYLFGYYIIQFYEADHGLNLDADLWKGLKEIYHTMKQVEETGFQFSSKLKF